MNREDIIRMAREVGGLDFTSHGWTTWVGTQSTDFLERFAALVASAEREACAKVCEKFAEDMTVLAEWGASQCANAIRAREQS